MFLEDAFNLDLTSPDTAHYLGAGWSGTEWGWTWTLGEESLLILPTPPEDYDCRLLIRALPFLTDRRPAQSLHVFANGWHFGTTLVRQAGFVLHAFDISRHAYTNRVGLAVSLRHPDAASPEAAGGVPDPRELAFGVSQIRVQFVTPEYADSMQALQAALRAPLARSAEVPAGHRHPADAELVQHFESLGSNCELGFVQRQAGAEPIGLLRFAGLPVDKMLTGLDDGYKRIATSGRHHVDLVEGRPDEGFLGRDDNYTLLYHTYRQPAEVSADKLLADEAKRLPFLARKLADDLEDGEKIFVVKNDEGLHLDDILVIEALVRRRGRGVVLWVAGADVGHPPGSVEVLRPGLMRGRVDRFARLTLGVGDISQAIWLDMLRNAWALSPRARLS